MKLTPSSFLHQNITKQFNLNELYLRYKDQLGDFNPYNAGIIQQLLDDTQHNLAYGGYGEDRKDVWAKTYLQNGGNFIHLGVDINCAAHSRVYAPFDATIAHSCADDDKRMGWGGCVVLASASNNYYWVLAHLDPLALPKTGKKLKAGEAFSLVGTWPHNGNTFNHLHIQAMKTFFDDMRLLDGYGIVADLTDNINPFTIDL